MNYREAEQFLFQRARFGMVLGLDRVLSALGALGDPHRAFRSVHVAGTNGKGSTCALVESALRASGARTGLYTSPHLVRFAERFRVAGEAISEAGLVALLERVLAACPDMDLTFFELATVMAFLHFAQSDVEIAVVEVGLGGRLDATNVLAPEVAVLTPIGLDHTDVLGPTLADVAREKCGILKPGVPAVSARQHPEAAAVIGERARFEGRDFSLEDGVFRGRSWRIDDLHPALAGAHQIQNAAVAAAALEVLFERVGSGDPEAVRRGFAAVRWPGRLETVRARPTVILDGAHNSAAAEVLARAVGKPATIVFGAMRDKDAPGMIRALSPVAARWHVCAADNPRARAPAELAIPGAQLHPSVRDAVEAAIAEAGPDGLVLVTGSLYVVGEARRALVEDPPGMRVSEVSLQPGERKVRLFVYGTLRTGREAHALLAGLPGARLVGPGVVSGTLFDLGAYPGAVLGGGGAIEGELWEFDDRAGSLEALDRYEGDGFVRASVEVLGSAAWMYVLAGGPPSADVPSSA